jgi:hypothetical protein
MTFTAFACKMESTRQNRSISSSKEAHPDGGIIGEVPKVCKLPTDGRKLFA